MSNLQNDTRSLAQRLAIDPLGHDYALKLVVSDIENKLFDLSVRGNATQEELMELSSMVRLLKLRFDDVKPPIAPPVELILTHPSLPYHRTVQLNLLNDYLQRSRQGELSVVIKPKNPNVPFYRIRYVVDANIIGKVWFDASLNDWQLRADTWEDDMTRLVDGISEWGDWDDPT